MIPWYAPTSLKDHLQRLISLRSALVLCVIMALAVTELRFDWIESTVGAYMVTTNSGRPQSGAVWDQGHQSDEARRTLSQYMNERTDVQREARGATSMGQVLAGIDPERGAMISADHFIELYQKLPPVLSHEIVSPYTLLTQMSTGKWIRTFFEFQGEQLSIYFLDGHNQVLHRLSLGPVLVEHVRRGEVAIQSRLDRLSDFAAQIYPAEQFFAALDSLSDGVRRQILDSPGNLLRVSGRIVRVGISDRPVAGIVEIGFEIEEAQGFKVILTQGQVSAVRQLQWLLEDQSVSSWPDDEGGRH